jgi:hypothetical protein
VKSINPKTGKKTPMKTPLSLRCKTIAGVWLAVGSLTSVIVPAAYASFISNGSFEADSVPAGGYSSITPQGWTKAGSVIPLVYHWLNPGGWPMPAAGNQYVDIGNIPSANAPISQSFTVGTAGAYNLTWFDNTFIGYGSSYAVFVLDSSSGTIATSTFSFSGTTSWNARLLSMTLGSGSYTLKFAPSGNPNVDTLLDNVSLDAVAVPEPTTMIAGVLLLLPFGVSTLRALRQRRHSGGGLSHE